MEIYLFIPAETLALTHIQCLSNPLLLYYLSVENTW